MYRRRSAAYREQKISFFDSINCHSCLTCSGQMYSFSGFDFIFDRFDFSFDGPTDVAKRDRLVTCAPRNGRTLSRLTTHVRAVPLCGCTCVNRQMNWTKINPHFVFYFSIDSDKEIVFVWKQRPIRRRLERSNLLFEKIK